MGAIVIGLRPSDHERLRQIAESRGYRLQDLAGIYLERAIRRNSSTRLRASLGPQNETPVQPAGKPVGQG